MIDKVVRVNDDRNTRRRTRRVDSIGVAEDAARKAGETGRTTIVCRTGGGVANAYRYPALTDAVLAVAVCRNGGVCVAVWATEIPANKATNGGAAAACVPAARPVFDFRYGADMEAWARVELERLAWNALAEG